MFGSMRRVASTAVLATITGLLLPTLFALADDGPAGSELRGAYDIWITCGVFVILGMLGLFYAWRTGQFDNEAEDVKYRMLDAEDPADLELTQWQPKVKKRRVRKGGQAKVAGKPAEQSIR